jgi:hypothetical protein
MEALDQDTILRLLGEFGLKLSYHREGFGAISNTTNGQTVHNFTDFKIGGAKGKKVLSVHEEIEDVMARKIGSDRQARKFTKIDFSLLATAYRQVPGQEDGSLTEGLVASYILGARVDSYLASSYMSGYVCDPLSSVLMKRRFLDLIRRRERDTTELDLFQEKLLPDGRKVREVVNSGEASFSDALSVIHEGRRFKEWLLARNPDESLLTEYFREVSKTGWVQRLPPKTYRFVITSGLGIAAGAAFSPIVGTLAGLGLTAIDTFLVDRLLNPDFS